MRRIVWMECTGVPGALGVTAKMEASLGGWRVADDVVDAMVCYVAWKVHSTVEWL